MDLSSIDEEAFGKCPQARGLDFLSWVKPEVTRNDPCTSFKLSMFDVSMTIRCAKNARAVPELPCSFMDAQISLKI